MASRTTRRSFIKRAEGYLRRRWKQAFGPRVRPVIGERDDAFLRRVRIDGKIPFADALLRHLGTRIAADWPGVPRVLTDLRINLDEMDDEQVVVRAEAAMSGDIHPSGTNAAMTDAGQPDWRHNPAGSVEWLLMLHRHAWWPLWGEAYRRTGDERYARAFVTQLTDWIAHNPMPAQMAEHEPSWRLMETGLRMRISWLPAFGCFFESPAFTNDAKLSMLRSIYDHGQFLHRFHTNRNHLVRESNGLLATGCCFPEFDAAVDWVDAALGRLDREIAEQVNEDGSHIEMSTGYQWLTIDEFEVTRALIGRYAKTLPRADLDDVLTGMYEYLAAVIRPDRRFPQLNDGFILWDWRRLASAGEGAGRPDIEFAASAGELGVAPTSLPQSFPNAGLHVMRSGWSADARYLVADTGPYGGPHGHEDKLSFELYAYGSPFIVDPGSYTYAKDDPYREYFVGSQAHNTVMVDGCSQVRRWNPVHLDPVARADVHGDWYSDDAIDYAYGDYDEGYAKFALRKPDDATVIDDVVHRRGFVFAKPDYWLVVDALEAARSHDYAFLFHLAPGVDVEEEGDGASLILTSEKTGARLLLAAVSSQPLTQRVTSGAETPIQGWYSSDHHRKCPAPAVEFGLQGADSALVTWVLYPLSRDANRSEIRIEGVPSSGSNRHDLVIARDGQSDRVRVAMTVADPARVDIDIERDDNPLWSSRKVI